MKAILVALPSELNNIDSLGEYKVFYTGVGKVNAAAVACEAIFKHGATEIVNFGTAGAVNKKHSGLVRPDVIIQRDMLAEPQAPRGYTPFDESKFSGAIVSMQADTNVTLGTGDSFVMAPDPWFKYANVDIVDMEAYAIAKICGLYGITFTCYKWVSDYADENAAETWVENQSAGAKAFIKEIESWM